MRKVQHGIVLVLAALIGLVCTSSAQEGGERPATESTAYRIIVKYKPEVLTLNEETAKEKAARFSEALELDVEHVILLPLNAHVILVRDPKAERNYRAIIKEIEKDPAVKYSELDSIMTTQPGG